jgi:peptidoglycan/xylan/chitin deacetylase (PgdA/CDA1 family)
MALQLLSLLTRPQWVFPFYHTVSNERLPHIEHLYPVRSIAQFTADIRFFLRHFTPISLHEVIAHIQTGASVPKNAFHLTFDDGLRECYSVIAPILRAHHIPATFFINPAFVDNRALMFRNKASLLIDRLGVAHKQRLLAVSWAQQQLLDQEAERIGLDFDAFLRTQQPYMSTSEIADLQAQGFTLGAHSVSHPHYHLLSVQEQLAQTLESQAYLRQQFGVSYQTFAFPFSDFQVTPAFFESIFHEHRFSLTFGTAGLKQAAMPQHLHRIPMERKIGSASLIFTEMYLRHRWRGVRDAWRA